MLRSTCRWLGNQCLVVVRSPYPYSLFQTDTNTLLLEHLGRLLTSSQENLNQSLGHYKLMLRKIFDSPIGPLQATKTTEGNASYNITSNYLCLQCPTIVTEEDRIKHGSKKAHRFCMLPSSALRSSSCPLTVYGRCRLSYRLSLLPDV